MAGFIPASTGDEKLLQKRVAEACRRAVFSIGPWFTGFLSLREQELALAQLQKECFTQYKFFGGYEDAQRKVLCIFSDGANAHSEAFPFVALKATYAQQYELEHRDFLGAALALGLTRASVGDINAGKGECVFFALNTAAQLMLNELTSVGRASVKIAQVATGEGEMPSAPQQDIEATVASLRLDAVLAAVLHKNREFASKLIDGGLVKVNDRALTQGAFRLTEGDYFTVRGYGKYCFTRQGGASRKNRIFITCKKM